MENIQYNDAFQSSLDFFNGNDLAAKVFLDKYALRDNEGNLLEKTPDDTLSRVAGELARIEKKKFKKPLTKEEILEYLEGFKRIVPQGSCLYGIGNYNQYITLSNCFVVDSPRDSYGGIMYTDEQLVQISKRRGGVGLDVSKLRPSGTPTSNSARTSTGVLSFMERFSNSIREVAQRGRRGALMITISVHHPEVLNFANAKRETEKITGANLSIRLSDKFLEAVDKDEEYEQRWPVEAEDGEPVISYKVNAREVWRQIIQNSWRSGEPGLLLWDTVIRESPADCYSEQGFKSTSTNPCSELILCPLDSCRLLLLNLFGYVKFPFTSKAFFDYDMFYKDAQIAQRFMDDIVDLEVESIDRIIKKIKSDDEPAYIKGRELNLWKNIRKKCTDGRRTGTGTTGLGDTIAALGFKYASNRSMEEVDKIYSTLKRGCYRSSVDMAKELGAFPVWNSELEKDNPFLNRIEKEDQELYKDMQQYGRRNIALLTCAPAGSMSILTQTTSGVEPLFAMSYLRRKKINPNDENATIDFVDQTGDSWQEFKVWHPKINLWKEITGKTNEEESPWFGACANDINWKNRVKLQAIMTTHIDHAISSTINLPNNATVENVAEIYENAWKMGAKGITVYRDGCRTGVMVAKKEKELETINKTTAPKRPKTLPCNVHHISVKGEGYFVLVGMMDNEPYEVFAGKNGHLAKSIKTGEIKKVKRGCYKAIFDQNKAIESIIDMESEEEEAMTRMISCGLRHGADISFIVHQLEKTRGEMSSFAKSIARALKKYIPDGTKISGETCLGCQGSNMRRENGCKTCMDCGWTACS